MRSDYEDPIRRLLVEVEQDHPGPRPQDESCGSPPATKLSTRERKRFKRSQRTRNSRPSVIGEVERGDCLVHVPLGLRGDGDLRHSGNQVVERRAFATRGLRKPLLRPFPGTRDRIQDFSNAGCIRIGIIESRRKKGAGKGPLLHVRPLGESGQLARVLVVKRDVDSACRGCHAESVHEKARFV